MSSELQDVQNKVTCVFKTRPAHSKLGNTKHIRENREPAKTEQSATSTTTKEQQKQPEKKTHSKPHAKKSWGDTVILATQELNDDVQKIIAEGSTLLATEKLDGTCCLIREDKLWRRYDRKLSNEGEKKRKNFAKTWQQWNDKKNEILSKRTEAQATTEPSTTTVASTAEEEQIPAEPKLVYDIEVDIKPPPEGWVKADDVKVPNEMGHYVGWVPVTSVKSEDKWHASSVDFAENKVYVLHPAPDTNELKLIVSKVPLSELNGHTFELIGPKQNGNPYKFAENARHVLVRHGGILFTENVPLEFEGLKNWFENSAEGGVEGVVWHSTVGKLFKLHRQHLGLKWPVENTRWKYNPEWNIEVNYKK